MEVSVYTVCVQGENVMSSVVLTLGVSRCNPARREPVVTAEDKMIQERDALVVLEEQWERARELTKLTEKAVKEATDRVKALVEEREAAYEYLNVG